MNLIKGKISKKEKNVLGAPGNKPLRREKVRTYSLELLLGLNSRGAIKVWATYD